MSEEAKEPPLEGELLPLIRDDYEGENLGGRPRMYETPRQFDDAVNLYYEAVKATPGEPITLYGLILSMGFTDYISFNRYSSYEGFSQSVSRARSLVKYGYERAVLADKNSAAARVLSAMDPDNFNPALRVENPEESHEARLARLR